LSIVAPVRTRAVIECVFDRRWGLYRLYRYYFRGSLRQVHLCFVCWCGTGVWTEFDVFTGEIVTSPAAEPAMNGIDGCTSTIPLRTREPDSIAAEPTGRLRQGDAVNNRSPCPVAGVASNPESDVQCLVNHLETFTREAWTAAAASTRLRWNCRNQS
jgi:hypothetical protein